MMVQPRHSPHGFGVLSLKDAPFFRDVLHCVIAKFECINMIEVGVANGGTTIGVYNLCKKQGVPFRWHGLDIEVGRPNFDLGDWGTFHCGDCHETHSQVPSDANLLFIDGCHCYECVKLDFDLYSPKVVKGGSVIFHDTCSSPKWQDHHIQCKPDRFIETRRALRDLGLYPLVRNDYEFVDAQNEGDTQGMMLFQKR